MVPIYPFSPEGCAIQAAAGGVPHRGSESHPRVCPAHPLATRRRAQLPLQRARNVLEKCLFFIFNHEASGKHFFIQYIC